MTRKVCKGCGLCVTIACPQGVMEMSGKNTNAKGFPYAEVKDLSNCTGCADCYTMCPDVAITVSYDTDKKE